MRIKIIIKNESERRFILMRIKIHIIIDIKICIRITIIILIRIIINIKMGLDTISQMCYYNIIRNIKIRIEMEVK